MLAGAFTESTVIGTAGDAINRLDIPEEQKQRELNNIPMAYAVTYLVGTAFVVWFLSTLAPRLLRVDLRAASRKLESESASAAEEEPGVQSGYRRWALRAFRVENPELDGRTVAALEAGSAASASSSSGSGTGDELADADPETVLHTGDVVALMALRSVIVEAKATHRPRGRRPGAARPPDRGARRRPHQQAGSRTESLAEIAGGTGAAWPCRSSYAPDRRCRSRPLTTLNRGDLLQTRRPAAARRAGGRGARVRRPADQRHGHGLRRPRHRGRRLVRPALGRRRRSVAHAHRERRRAHRGPRLRLAALGAPDVRPHPRARPVGVRHRRARHVHRRGRPGRRADLRRRPASTPA